MSAETVAVFIVHNASRINTRNVSGEGFCTHQFIFVIFIFPEICKQFIKGAVFGEIFASRNIYVGIVCVDKKGYSANNKNNSSRFEYSVSFLFNGQVGGLYVFVIGKLHFFKQVCSSHMSYPSFTRNSFILFRMRNKVVLTLLSEIEKRFEMSLTVSM